MRRKVALIIVALLGLSAQSRGQALVPFIGPGAALFAPQISVINSGTVNDVQAVVSADRKYVTLNMRPTISNVVSINIFSFQSDQVGFVGGNPHPAPAPGAPAGLPIPKPVRQPGVQVAPGILSQPGMTKLN